MKRQAGWIVTALSVSVLLILVFVPSSRAQVVRISKGVLLLPRALWSLPPKALGSAMLRSPLMAAAKPPGNGVIVGASYHNDTSPPLRDMEPVPAQLSPEHEANANPKLPFHHKDSPDEVVQSVHAPTPSMPAAILNFDGIPFPGVVCSCAPPDTDGEVGLTQYVQIVNEGYQVFNKTTGASVLGPLAISTIWTGFGGLCEFNGHGDPIVLYDQIANRWLVSQFAGTSFITDECIAVSTTADATGSYNRYGFHLTSTVFMDYPKISVWPDAYYMSMNVFNSAGTAFLGPQPFAFDRAAMLAGAADHFVSTGITGGPAEDGYLPADLDGSTLPPAGTPATFVEFPARASTRSSTCTPTSPCRPTRRLLSSPARPPRPLRRSVPRRDPACPSSAPPTDWTPSPTG